MDTNYRNRKNGKVWLVGAGPGDAELITVKGRDVLSKAETVVYDALIGSGILSMMPEDAEKIYVGKRFGRHTLAQEEINRLLLEKALDGKRVVRLKGGDPFLFGRGGEELELLKKHGIEYEIVPGISSAFAVPAYAGIPVTHRDKCSSVHVITGHKRKDHTYDIDFKALKEAGGTLVFLMGISSLPVITKGLLDAGMDAGTPAAIVEKGTTAAQRTVRSTLGVLEKTACEYEVKAPAVIIVGGVAGLADEFSWREMLPLAGVRAVVTRPKELSSGLASMLRERGSEVTELPTIKIVPLCEDISFADAVRKAADGGYEWMVFTSPSGVKMFMDRLLAEHDIRLLAGIRMAVIGRGSEKELLKYGVRADLVPSKYDGRTLGKELAAVLEEGDRVLIPRARTGNKELTEELAKVPGVIAEDIPTYDTEYTAVEWFDADEAFDDEYTFAVFTSASTVRGFAYAYPDMDHSKVQAVCIGEMTANEAAKHGMKIHTAEQATLESLAEALEKAAEEIR